MGPNETEVAFGAWILKVTRPCAVTSGELGSMKPLSFLAIRAEDLTAVWLMYIDT